MEIRYIASSYYDSGEAVDTEHTEREKACRGCTGAACPGMTFERDFDKGVETKEGSDVPRPEPRGADETIEQPGQG